jgi:hypothetical protein
MIKFFKYVYIKFIFDPLAGGNGKVQMDEMAKVLLLVMIGRASWREGDSPDQLYPDIYWICLFGAVCAIAAIKPAFQKLKQPQNDTTIN